jgi:type I restriction enzyme, S subunit
MTRQTVPLGDVATFVRGITFKPDDVGPPGVDGRIACLRTKNVQEELDLNDVWGIPTNLVKRKTQFLAPGDLLVSTANSWNLVGKCSWIPKLPWHATFGGFVSVLRAAPERINARYLYHWFSLPKTQALVRGCARRTTSIANMSVDQCLALLVPLPSLDEQQRIAALLDQADSVRRKRRASIDLLDELLLSVFSDVFSKKIGIPLIGIKESCRELPEGWAWRRLQDVAEMKSGHTPSRNESRYWEGGTIPWLTLGDIRAQDGKVIADTKEHITNDGIENSSAVLLPPGTVCLARTASVGFVTVSGCGLATSQDFVNWICGSSLDPIFLMWAFIASRRELLSLAPGSTHHTIYFRLFDLMHMAVPPLDLQRSFRQRAEAIRSLISLHQIHLEDSERLIISLQSRAFSQSGPSGFERPPSRVAAE